MKHPEYVQQVIDLYLDHLKWRASRGTFEPRHLTNISRTLNNFGEMFGHQTFEQCSRRDVSQWLEANPQWKSFWTLRHALSDLSSCFCWALDEELLQVNPYPSRAIRKLFKQMPAKTRRSAATDAEYVALMRCGSRAIKRIAFFLYRVGTRPCEPRRLTWSEVDLNLGICRIVDHKTMRQQAEPRPREFAVGAAALRLLRNMHKRRPKGTDNVFLNCHGKPWGRSSLCEQFKKTIRRALNKKAMGLNRFQKIGPEFEKISPYCLRHTCATRAAENGVSDQQANDHFGWTSSVMWSTVYKHTGGKVNHLRAVADKITQRIRSNGKDARP